MYQDVFKQFEDIAIAEAKRLAPNGFDASDNAPQTLTECQAYFKTTGKVCVSRDIDNDTIYATPHGNQCFRAWHDLVHLRLGAEFDRAGEYNAFLEQSKDLRAACDDPERLAMLVNVLRCEIMGQFDYKTMTGDFPQYKREFTIDYLEGRH